jgi:hypothetical protein
MQDQNKSKFEPEQLPEPKNKPGQLGDLEQQAFEEAPPDIIIEN